VGPFEYLLIFAAIVLGLAVSDLAFSLHRLLGAGARVKWDWLAPMAAAVAFLKITTQWWSWFGLDKLATGLTWGMYLGVLTGTVLLFLLAAAALPDEVGEGVDLKAYYAGISRRYWILFTAEWVLMGGVGIWAQMQIEGARLAFSPIYLVVLVSASLAIFRARWWHALCLAVFIVTYVGQFFGDVLGG